MCGGENLIAFRVYRVTAVSFSADKLSPSFELSWASGCTLMDMLYILCSDT